MSEVNKKIKDIHRKDYQDFLLQVNYGRIDDVDTTHDGYPLSAKEAKFIDLFLVYGNLTKAMSEAGLKHKDVVGKDYLTNEIRYRLDLLKKETIADADEVMQYFTRVMRNEEKDQFGLDAPLVERTRAATELAKRLIDMPTDNTAPSINVVLNWDGMPWQNENK